MDAFRDLVVARTPHRGDIARLAKNSGVAATLLSRYRDGSIRPGTETLERLAPYLGADYSVLLQMCGYLPSDAEPPVVDTDKIPVQDKQDAIHSNYETWMAVMGPRMGREAAHNQFWDPILQRAAEQRAEAERAREFEKDLENRIVKAVNADRDRAVKQAANAETHSPNSRETGPDGSISLRYQPVKGVKTRALAGVS